MDTRLPGSELVAKGLSDLEAGVESVEALLVTMAAPRLRRLGIDVGGTTTGDPAGHRLYALLEADDPRDAHSRYNALVGRMVSFARAAEHARIG